MQVPDPLHIVNKAHFSDIQTCAVCDFQVQAYKSIQEVPPVQNLQVSCSAQQQCIIASRAATG